MLGIEPIHRIDETEAGNLDEVVVVLAATTEATGDVLGEREAAGDDLVSKTVRSGRALLFLP